MTPNKASNDKRTPAQPTTVKQRTMDHPWKIFLLMDHREFQHTKNNFAPRAKSKIDRHFASNHPVIDAIHPHYCERTHLVSGDYMFVARQFDETGSIVDERVLDLVVERKSVDDLQGCLIKKSKTCAPLSFFEAQMYKLQQTPGMNRVFLMEGDEDKPGENGISQVGNPGEWDLRRKRVKTMRNQIRGDEWVGVSLVCTTDKNHSVQYLVDRMAEFMKDGFDSGKLHLYKTMAEYKQIVNERMKDATFLEYLRLRSIKGTGDVKAMKSIMDPDGPWDKSFVSPACIARDKKYKSNLEDRAEYYVSNNVGGMSKMGNAILSSSTSTAPAGATARKLATSDSLPKENLKPTAQNSSVSTASAAALKSNKSTNSKDPSNTECRKCLRELESGVKDNTRHDAGCPKKKTKRQNSSNSSDEGNKSRKRSKPSEPVYYNPNPAKRASILDGDIDGALISSIHSVRSDLSGGSGLGVGGFDITSSHGNASVANVASRSKVASTSRRSSSDNSPAEVHPVAAAARKKYNSNEVIELDSPDSVAPKRKSSSLTGGVACGIRKSDEVVLLDDSDDEGQQLDKKPRAVSKSDSSEVEVIEIE